MEQPRHVRYIRTIARTRSISAAARELHLSQPALSAQLKKQEKRLGAELFDRSTNPLSLTEAGLAYLRYEDKANELRHELEKELANISDLTVGKLVIGGATFFNVAYVPSAIEEFSRTYPGVRIEIMDGTTQEMIEAALRGEVDVLITADTDSGDFFAYEELVEERLVLCVPADWDVNKEIVCQEHSAGACVIKPDQLRKLEKERFVTLRESQHLGRRLAKLLALDNVHVQNTVVTEQTLTAFALTQAGVGISLVPESVVKHSADRETPRLYHVDDPISLHKLYAAYPAAGGKTRAATEFARMLASNTKRSLTAQHKHTLAAFEPWGERG